MAPGPLSHPGRVSEQRLLSPEIHWRRSYGTVLEILPIDLGFSVLRLLISEGASSEVDQGGLTMGGRGQGLGRAALLCGQSVDPLPAPVWSSSFVRVK
jgi:hypothetical protein